MTTTLTATTPEGAALSDLASIVAGCGEFQEAAGVTSAEEALAECVHYPLQDSGVPVKFPFAVLTSMDYQENRLAGDCYLPSGTISLILGRHIENSEDAKVAELEFLNFEGAVIRAITAASGGGGHYVWQPVQSGPPARTDARHESGEHACPPFYQVMYECQWSAL